MMLYLSRLSLTRDPSTAALKELIDPRQRGHAMDAQHRLLWSAFAENAPKGRDFLWRAEGKGIFHVLSKRPPGKSALFDRPEVKQFEPRLEAGDRLQFILRVNATKARPQKYLTPGDDGRPRNRRVDIVMASLHEVAPGERAQQRMEIAQDAGTDWLKRQGGCHGFRLLDMTVADYSVVALPKHRGARAGQPQFGVLDMTGRIEVVEPEPFLTKLADGFGRARSFGCGLMLIRRCA